jgi:predicted glycoside hydrolase/deacetylase ChbG (UPF0249 family)
MVVADDFGIGPETSRAIVELAQLDAVTATVVMVNSPHAENALKRWRGEGISADLGWHPCLTMDEPVAPAGEVASLVNSDGRMGPLGWFLKRLMLRQVRAEHIRRELNAQLDRFRELTGHPPCMVNTHQHVAIFPPVGAILREVLRPLTPRPFLRRVKEPWSSYVRVPDARVKRAVLSLLGRREAARQRIDGFPGADSLAGITALARTRDRLFFDRWLSRISGDVVELMCHPGHFDVTLAGRDCQAHDGLQQGRVDEDRLLREPAFSHACRQAGFTLARPSDLMRRKSRNVA